MLPAVLRAVLAVFLLIGCLPYSEVRDPAPPFELPKKFDHGYVAKQAGGRWWESFDSKPLNAVIERALVRSFDMQTAWSALEVAQAVARGAGAPLWPTVSADFGVGYQFLPASRFPNPACQEPGGCPADEPAVITNPAYVDQFYNLSIPVSYEIDLFGRNFAKLEVSQLEVIASRDDVEAAAMTVAASVADAWFQLIADQASIEIYEAQLEAQETFLSTMEARYESRISSLADVYQQRNLVTSTRIALRTAEATFERDQYALAMLLGEPKQALETLGLPQELPVVPDPPKVDAPLLLLANRPDVRASRIRVTTADIQVGIAIAEYFPTISVSAGINWGNPNLSDLFDQVLWSLSGSISQSIFRGFSRAASVDQAAHVVRQQLVAFGRTLLTAINEVETAILGENQQADILKLMEEQLQQTTQSYDEAKARYAERLVDFQTILNAQASLQNAQLQMIEARRLLLSRRVQLHRATGGLWTRKLAQPIWVDPKDGPKVDVPPVKEPD